MNPLSRRSFLAAGAMALPGLSALHAQAAGGSSSSRRRLPVVYSTDLMHPHDDPDDHFDLACLYSLPEVDIRAIILDNGEPQAQRPGYKPVWQLNYLSGRHVPAAIGLCRKLKSPDDSALDQPAEHQNGVNLMLQALQDSAEKVTIITMGSVRDVVAAFNREPRLFRTKVAGIYCFIGEASDPRFIEYNVGLDLQAFLGLMRSGLPVFWVPCFDGGLWQNKGHASYWKIRHREVLEGAPAPLVRYFLYMLRQEKSDPIAYLSQTTPAHEQEWIMNGERNLWGAGLLGLIAGRRLRQDGRDVAGFSPVEVSVSESGIVSYRKRPGSHRVMQFTMRDRAGFAQAATAATADLLRAFPLRYH